MLIWKDAVLEIHRSPLYQTLSSAVITADCRLLVDPAWLPEEIEHLQAWVATQRPDLPLYVLFTHADYDHILGAGAFPEAHTIGHARFLTHPDPEAVLAEIRAFDAKYYLDRQHPLVFPRPEHAVTNGDLQIGRTGMTFWDAPGHTDNGLFALLEGSGVLWVGDYLSDFELPFVYHCADAYRATLELARRLIMQQDVRLLVPGHGRPTADRQEMLRRVDTAEQHLEALFRAVADQDQAALRALGQAHAFQSDFTQGCHDLNVRLVQEALRRRSGGPA